MKSTKRLLSVFLLAVILAFFATPPAEALADSPYMVGAQTLTIDGQVKTLEKPILVVDGRSMLPMRSFFEMLGASVTWDGATRTATATRNSHTLSFTIDNPTILVDDQPQPLDVPAQLIEGATYVPIRAAAENLGYDVLWSKAGIQLAQRTPSFIAGVDHFSRAWSAGDRSHFGDLLGQVQADPATARHTAYLEYQDLARAVASLDTQAIHSKRGYVLYQPALVTEINSVWTAMTARTLLLEDLATGTALSELDTYYPRNYWYQQVDEDYFQVPEYTDFSAFNLDAATNLLENLQIPDFVLYGLRIYYVPGYSPTASGYNAATGLLGHFGDQIVVFDEKAPASWVLETLAHEVGHSVGKDIFYQWPDSIVSPEENQESARAYATGIHGRTDYVLHSDGAWGTDIAENFADDFMHLTTGMDKVAAWRDAHDPEIRALIDARVTNGMYQGRVPMIQQMKFVVNGTEIPMLNELDWGDLRQDHYLVTGEARIQLKAEGYIAGKMPMGVAVGDQEFLFDASGVCTVTLPAKGQVYDLKVGVFSPGLREYFFRLPVVYGDF